MTAVEFGLIAIALILLFLVARKFSGPVQPQAPIEPAGPSDIGALATIRVRNPVIPVPYTEPDSPSSAGLASELEKLSVLHTSGALSEAEFDQAKQQLLQGKAPVSDAKVAVIMTDLGSNKIHAIQALRQTRADLDLAGTKRLVDGLPTPQTLFQGLNQDDAARIKKYLNAAGVTIQIR